jgi:rRNA processing protein Gar1
VPAETVASYLSDNNIGKIYDILGQVLQVYASRVTAAGA